MAESKYVKAKDGRTVTVLKKDGTSETLEPGQPIAVSDLQEHLVEGLKSDDEYISGVLEPASREDVDSWNAGHRPEPPKDFDRMQHLEGVTLPSPGEEASVQPAREERQRSTPRREGGSKPKDEEGGSKPKGEEE